jgi:predicted benzoate:H+ symporter BenE
MHLVSLLLGLAGIALLTYVVGSLTEAFYAARHATPAAGGTGDELGLELAVIFAMFIGFVASVPFGFFVYRYASKRLLKAICGD